MPVNDTYRMPISLILLVPQIAQTTQFKRS